MIGIAFAVGLAGSTGAMVVTGKKAAVADSAHAVKAGAEDSAAADVKADSGHAPVHPDSGEKTAVTHDSVAKSAPAAVAEASPATAAPAHAEPVAAAPKPAAPAPDYPRLAKIFAAMPAAQSVELLGHMNDGDVEGIIRSLGVRQQAAIMAALPKERAAEMSKRLLVPHDTATTK
jgi:hypothetical protein